MIKLFGLRVTPFFMFILGLECLALLVSIYVGTLLHREASIVSIPVGAVERSIYSGFFIIFLIFISTPAFFNQTWLTKIKKSINGKIGGFIGALLTMTTIVFSSNTGFDSKALFTAALLSACVGFVINQTGLFDKYWRFLVRAR